MHVTGLDDHAHFARRRPGDRGAGDEHTRHIRLHRCWIVDGRALIAFERDAEHFEERRILAIASQQQHEISRDLLVEQNRIFADLPHARPRKKTHVTVSNQRANLRQQPELDHFRIEVLPPVADRHIGAGTRAANRSLDRRVAAADDEQALAKIFVRITEVMADVGEVFAGNADQSRRVHCADGQYQNLGANAVLRSLQLESAARQLIDLHDALVRADCEPKVLHERTQIGEKLLAADLLLMRRLDRHVCQRKAIGARMKKHLWRIPLDR